MRTNVWPAPAGRTKALCLAALGALTLFGTGCSPKAEEAPPAAAVPAPGQPGSPVADPNSPRAAAMRRQIEAQGGGGGAAPPVTARRRRER